MQRLQQNSRWCGALLNRQSPLRAKRLESSWCWTALCFPSFALPFEVMHVDSYSCSSPVLIISDVLMPGISSRIPLKSTQQPGAHWTLYSAIHSMMHSELKSEAKRNCPGLHCYFFSTTYSFSPTYIFTLSALSLLHQELIPSSPRLMTAHQRMSKSCIRLYSFI